MDREFIPYELALELKQLGFDEPCLSYYEGESFSYHLASIKGDDYIIPAPLFQQVFRWFREEHKLIAGIFPNNHSLQDNVSYIGYVGKFKKGNVEVYETYEEAEKECLIKLIEIVKGGNKL